MNTFFRCLESRIDKNNTLYGKFSLDSIPSGQGNTFANSLRRSLLSDLSGLAITHFCIMSKPGLNYEFTTLPGLTESLLDFSLNLKKVVLSGRIIEPFLDETSSVENVLHSQVLSSHRPQVYNLPVVPNMVESKMQMLHVQSKAVITDFTKDDDYSAPSAGARTPSSPSPSPKAMASPSVTATPVLASLSITNPEGVEGDGDRGTYVQEGATRGKRGQEEDTVGKSLASDQDATHKHTSYLSRANAQGTSQSPSSKSDLFKKSQVRNLSLAPIGFLKVKGPAILRASDLILPPGIRCVHPNQYLGTLAIDGVLSIKFLIAAGKGFIVQDEIIYNSLSRARLLTSSDMLENHKVKFNNTSMSYVPSPYVPLVAPTCPSPSPSATAIGDTVGKSFARLTFGSASLGKEGVSPKVATDSSSLAKLVAHTPKGYVHPLRGIPSPKAMGQMMESEVKITKGVNNSFYPVVAAAEEGSDRKVNAITYSKGDTVGKSFASDGDGDEVLPSLAPKVHLTTTPSVIMWSKGNKGVSPSCRAVKVRLEALAKVMVSSSNLRRLRHGMSILSTSTTAKKMGLPFRCHVGDTVGKSFASTETEGLRSNQKDTIKITKGNMRRNRLKQQNEALYYIQNTFQKYMGRSASQKNVLSINEKVYSMSFASLPFYFATQLTPFPMWYKLCQVIPCLPFLTSCFYQNKKLSDLLKLVRKSSPSNTQRVSMMCYQIKQNVKKLKCNGNSILPSVSISYVTKGEATPHQGKKGLTPSLPRRGTYGDTVGKGFTSDCKHPKNDKRPPVISLWLDRRPSVSACIARCTYPKGVRASSYIASSWMMPLVAPTCPSPSPSATAIGARLTLSRVPLEFSFNDLSHNYTKRGFLASFNKNKSHENYLQSKKRYENTFSYKSFVNTVNNNKKLSKKQLIWNSDDNSYPVLPLDVTFTPVSKVNFQININRDAEKNQETIILEIWTNGSITPKRALQESSLALAQDFYNLFCNVNEFSSLQSWWKRESIESRITCAPTLPNSLLYPVVAAGEEGSDRKVNAVTYYARTPLLSRKGTYTQEGASFASDDDGVNGSSSSNSQEMSTTYLTMAPLVKKILSRASSEAEPKVSHARESLLYPGVGSSPSPSPKVTASPSVTESEAKMIHEPPKVVTEKSTASPPVTTQPEGYMPSNTKGDKALPALDLEDGNQFLQKNLDSKTMHTQIKTFTKVKFSENKNIRLKQKIQYLHTFWRLNISDLNLSLKTQLLLKKLDINNVYDLHFFILKKSWSLFLNHQQKDEITKIYLNFGLNSPF